MNFNLGKKGVHKIIAISFTFHERKNIYPKEPRKLTGCVKKTHFVQIALTAKQDGLVWTFFAE